MSLQVSDFTRFIIRIIIIRTISFYSFRHETPTDPDDPLSDQNMKDRFYGSTDPVAEKLMRKYDSMPKLAPPEDRTITTLYVGNVVEGVTEAHLRDHFYQYGELRSVTVLHKQNCAFVQVSLHYFHL